MKSYRRSAFSMIELMVGVAVIAILISVLAVALRSARESGQTVKALARLGDCTKLMLLFCGDHKDRFPGAGPPFVNIPITVSGNPVVLTSYFRISDQWTSLLADGYLSGNSSWDIATDPRGGTIMLSCSLLADPDYFTETLWTGTGQLRSQRLGDIVSPAAKVVMTTNNLSVTFRGDLFRLYDPANRFAMSMADGHSAVVPAADGVPGRADGCGGGVDYAVHPADYIPGGHTRSGVRGRDIR